MFSIFLCEIYYLYVRVCSAFFLCCSFYYNNHRKFVDAGTRWKGGARTVLVTASALLNITFYLTIFLRLALFGVVSCSDAGVESSASRFQHAKSVRVGATARVFAHKSQVLMLARVLVLSRHRQPRPCGLKRVNSPLSTENQLKKCLD